MNIERYRNDPKYRRNMIYRHTLKGKEALKKAIRKYQHSPKGKEVMIECNKRFHKNHPTYSKDYAKSRRAEAKERGICTRCFKRKARIDKVLCSICLANNKKNNG